MDIYFYDQITSGDAERVVTQLAGAAGPVTVRINSPGGSVSEGLAIYNALARHNQRVEVHIDGLAASIASLIAMAGNRVYIARAGLLMIHAPWVSADGNAAELRQIADALDANAKAMVAAYTAKSGKSSSAILAMMAAETWLTADEALAARFVDEIVDPLPMAASVRFDLSAFHNPPFKVFEMTQENDPLAAERARTAAIRQVFALFPKYRHVEADCLADMSVTEAVARQRLLEEMGRGCEPLGSDVVNAGQRHISMGANQHHSDFAAAARDAVLARYGVKVKDPHPAAADVMGMSAIDIAQAMLSQQGRAPLMKTKAAIIKAAMTTSDFPDLMENIAEKAAMVGFQEQEVATHRVWTRESQLPDFKQARRVALSEAPGLAKVNEGGEYTYGSFEDAKESIQLATYGKIVSLTRQALINDDLGELTRVPQSLGQAAARKESDIVYALLTSNPTMRDGKALFHTDHGNLAGTGAAPSVATLGAARAAMRKQTGLAGIGYLNITPRYLIVPVALETAAEQLMMSIQPNTTENTVPAWVRQLIVVTDPRLDDDSATAWYLAGNPAAHDTIEVATLEGEQPYTEQDPGFDIDAVKIKIRIDVGAAAIDWRALYKNAGA